MTGRAEATEVATAKTASTGSASRLLRVQGMPLGKWLATTPGRLRLASVVLVGALLVALVVTASAATARHDAARALGLQAVPELAAVVRLDSALADADATASTIYLQAGLEDPTLRQRYGDDLAAAGDQLAVVARQAGSTPEARRAVRTISKQLAIYAGYIETARANIRQGFPVGASYQRRGSTLMREEILPAATTLYTRAAGMLDDNYRAGTSTTEITLVVAIGVVLLALLLAMQVLVTRRSNRILNVALVTATVLVLVPVAWTVLHFVSAQDSLVRAQRNGSDSVQLLSAARILTLQALSDENLALSERGTGNTYVQDFDSVMRRLGGSDGQGALLGEARAVARRTGTVAGLDAIATTFQNVLGTHDRVRALDDNSSYNEAVALATGNEAQAVHELDAGLRDEITRARRSLDADAADARSGFGLLALAIPGLLLLAGGLVLVGVQRRIAEYR